jgi:SAM-dependent methyltransferase
MASRSRIELENWLKTIDVNGRILDIGGSQNPIKGRTKSWNVEDYKILDIPNPHQIKHETDIAIDLQGNIEVITERDNFDIAFCIEVTEYLYNPYFFFLNANHFLKKNGILYVSFHALYGLHNPKGEDCLRYTKNAIIKLASETGFEIEEMIPRTVSEQGKKYLEMFYRTEGMRLDYSDPETYVEGYLVKMKKV